SSRFPPLDDRARLGGRRRERRAGAACLDLTGEDLESPARDGLGGVFHEAEEVPEVVDREKAVAGELTGPQQVAQIGPRVPSACGTSASFLQRPGVPCEFRPLQVVVAIRSQDAAVAGETGGDDAIEHVRAAGDGVEKTLRVA